MKFSNFILLFVFITSFISCKKEIKADEAFLESVVKNFKEQKSISYTVDYKIKYFDSDDTTKINADVKLIRNLKDTVFFGYVWYNAGVDSTYKNIEKYYAGDYSYLIINDSASIFRYDTKKEETFIFTGATDGETKNVYFMKPEKLIESSKDTINTTVIKDTMLGKTDYALVSINYPDEGDYINRINNVYINKSNKLIEKMTYRCQYLDQFQYNEWNLSNIKFNTVTKEMLDKKLEELTAKYTVEDYKPLTEEEMAPLLNGTTAPLFKAKLYKDNSEVSLDRYKGKIILLDFWYMSCNPCALAIPHLNKIQEKYKDKVVVLGVNAYDTDGEKIEKIPAFIKRTNLDYAIATIDFDVVKDYNIHVFPTLYIIDQKGIIQYSQMGFNEELEQILDQEIQKILK